VAGSLDQLVRDIRGFEGRREVLKALRARIRKPVPEIRKAIKARALDTLPGRGGLNVWVAAIRIGTTIKLSGRAAGVRLRGGRNSTGGRSDVKRIDRGRVRAPSWGRRTRGSWHTQTVPAGFFTKPAADVGPWRAECVAAVDEALEVIRRG
jgi:hypothetical protein